MSGHTPGPWQVVNAKDVFTAPGAPNAAGVCAEQNDGWQIADCGSFFGCVIGDSAHEMSMDEERANARLIAAAPELLAAAREALSAMDDIWETKDADDDFIYDEMGSSLAAGYFSLRAAIAKATE